MTHAQSAASAGGSAPREDSRGTIHSELKKGSGPVDSRDPQFGRGLCASACGLYRVTPARLPPASIPLPDLCLVGFAPANSASAW